MKRNTLIFILGWFGVLLLPSVSLGGGIVQELLTDGETSGTIQDKFTADTTKPMNDGTKTRHCSDKQGTSGTKTTNSHETEVLIGWTGMLQLSYDKTSNRILLTWKAHDYKGKHAFRYLIYRKSEGSNHWELIGVVDGTTREFQDQSAAPDQRYTYKVVGVYDIDGARVSLRYPQLHVTPNQQQPPIVGVGCQSTPSAPSAPWLLLLFLLPLLRRKRTTH